MTKHDVLLSEIELLLDGIALVARPLLSLSTPVVIYGAGGCGRRCAQIAASQGHHVLGFLDQSTPPTSERIVDGLRCLHPGSPEAKDWKQSQVIVAIYNPDHDAEEIARRLQALGYSSTFSFPDLHRQFDSLWGSTYSLGDYDLYHQEAAQIMRFARLLADESSLERLHRVLQFRLNGRLHEIGEPDFEHQYFPPDVPIHRDKLRFVDCGAYIGDTLEQMIENRMGLESVAAFEPDAQNFEQLCNFVKEKWAVDAPVFSWPCGVWSKTTQVHFADGQGLSSSVTSHGAQMIQAVALDDALKGFHPNFIKMDIEGAEPHALQGALRLIETYRPNLAICCYHEPQHLWTLPLLIESWNLNYRFFLRHHGFNGFDWVLYAVAG